MSDSLNKRFAIKLLANIVTVIINAVIVAVVPTALGPISYGNFNYLQQFFNQLIAFVDLGTSSCFFTKLSADNDRRELLKIYALFSISLFSVLFLLVLLAKELGYAEFLLSDIPDSYIFYGFWFGFLTWFTQIYVKISDAYALTVSVEAIKIIHKSLMLGVLLYFINYLPFDLYLYYYFHYLSLATFVIVISLVFHNENIFNIDVFIRKVGYKKVLNEFYQFCSPLLLFNIVAIGVGIIDIWLLQTVSGSIQTGFYGLAYSIAAMCCVFTSAMTPIITREFSKSFAKNDLLEMRRLFLQYVPILYALAAYFSIFIVFEVDNLLSVFTDERFKGAHIALLIIAFYPLHQTYGQINAALFFATDETRKYRNIGLISSLIGVIFSYLFIYQLEFGAAGFAFKMVLTQLIAVNIQLFFNVRKLKLNFFHFINHQIYTVVIFVMMAYFSSLIVDFENILVNIFVGGFLYSVLIVCCLCVFPSVVGVSKQQLFSCLLKIIKIKKF